ncbi:DNA mismatch repair protein Msh6 [Pluteus cervinus]|uniref:DNA mismatch repair protein Msh6 n=1 Tax=Pluteus cervinus TaxID=181527 RepID=A0ACD3B3T0_9AGAR|nr:DNA mismatch repair protein Msh6 [Pluteus cervinus]
MASQNKSANADKMKQKSLMTFFQKPSATGASKAPIQRTPAASSSAKSRPDASKNTSTSVTEPKTPEPKPRNTKALLASVAASSTSSYASSSFKDTPPSSDAIDVDMISDEDEDPVPRKVAMRKRKAASDDSGGEEESSAPAKRRIAKHRSESPKKRDGRVKKQRVAKALTDDDEGRDSDEPDEAATSFAQRLTQFKKPAPSQARNARSQKSDDDDDFIVPDDSDDDVRSVKSSSSRSSRPSVPSSEDVSDESDDQSKKQGKAKAKVPKGKAKQIATPATPSEGSFLFLTAAEQREQGKKNEKKSAEEPFAFLQDVRDKDKRRPGEPGYDPRSLYIPPNAWKTFTPFEKQFWEIKQNHYDTVLFFQKGKFLELYEDDARIGHQEFDLKLTQRVKMSMVGVPEMSFNFWAAKFLGKGYKVGRVDQAETALGAEMRMAANKGKGKVKGGDAEAKEKIVRRELNKVYTNGTLVDPELLHDDQAGHCIAITEEQSDNDSENKFGLCVLDCATSQFDLSFFEDDICRTKLETLMRQVRPKEILFTKGTLSVVTTRLLKAVLPAACLWTGLREQAEGFNYDGTLKELKSLYPAEHDESDCMNGGDTLPCSVPQPIRDMLDCSPAMLSLGSMIWYLRQLNIDKDILGMRNFNIYDPMKKGQGLVLDGQTLAHIEVILNSEGTEEGSLLKLLNRCITPFGKRLFRIWLCMPLRNVSDINARLDAVEELMNNPPFEACFVEMARGLPDLERIVARIHAKSCKVQDFLKVIKAFESINEGFKKLTDESEKFESKTILGLLRGAPDIVGSLKHVRQLFKPVSSKEKDVGELLPEDGKDKDYDDIMEEIACLEAELDDELGKFQKKLGIKLAYWHSSIGNKEIYLIETSAGQKGIPKDWTKSGATKAKARWVVGALQGKIRQLKEARENRNTAIKAFKFRLYGEFDADRALWLRAIRILAELDCLFSLAKSSIAIGEPSCRPEFVDADEAFVDFEELRHPTLCLSTNLKSFIPNDVKLGGAVGKVNLLTGPNMAGKSTLMRMTATGVIMAQLGMLVPAAKARISPVDAIITRMGAYDNMFSHASTFKVELDECCKILRDATPKSLVILDELGRGTSTYDGMAIAGAVLHQLATHTRPLCFFATHYGSLTDDFEYHPNIRNMHMSTIVDEEKKDIVFLFKLVGGAAAGSFGTHVANLAGVPSSVVERADVVSKSFSEQFKKKQTDKRQTAAAKLPLTAQADFAFLVKLAMGNAPLIDASRQKVLLSEMKKIGRRYT